MTFREIDEQITSLVDPETGEILDVMAFESLQMERDEKVENMAMWVLDLRDEVTSIDAEIERLKEKKRVAQNKMTSLKSYLQIVTGGQNVKTPLVSVSYRTNEAVNLIDKEAVIKWAQDTHRDDELLKYSEPDVSKTAVKKLIAEGVNVPGAEIVNSVSTIIK